MKPNLLLLLSFIFSSINCFSSSNNNKELGSIFNLNEINYLTSSTFYLPLSNNSYQLIQPNDKDFTKSILIDNQNKIISIENSGYNSNIFSNLEDCKKFF